MNDISNIVFESILKEAVIANFQDEMNAMPPEEQLRKEYAPSTEHSRKMKALFKSEHRRGVMRKLQSAAKAAVLILCVVTTIFFSVLMFNPQIRASVRQATVQFFEAFTRIEFDTNGNHLFDTNENPAENQVKTAESFTLGYIPSGYEQISFEKYGESAFMTFSDGNENLLIFNVTIPDTHAGDTEHRDFREENHAGITYYIYEAFESDNFSNVVWVQDGFMLDLTGLVSVDELLAIAFSVE